MTVPRENHAGFTLLEIMAVLSLLLLLVSLVGVRFDLAGSRSDNELRRLYTFLRTQHLKALRFGRVQEIQLRTQPDQTTVHTGSPTPAGPDLVLPQWRITHPSGSSSLLLSPSGVHGSTELTLRNESGSRRVLSPHRIHTVVAGSK